MAADDRHGGLRRSVPPPARRTGGRGRGARHRRLGRLGCRAPTTGATARACVAVSRHRYGHGGTDRLHRHRDARARRDHHASAHAAHGVQTGGRQTKARSAPRARPGLRRTKATERDAVVALEVGVLGRAAVVPRVVDLVKSAADDDAPHDFIGWERLARWRLLHWDNAGDGRGGTAGRPGSGSEVRFRVKRLRRMRYLIVANVWRMTPWRTLGASSGVAGRPGCTTG